MSLFAGKKGLIFGVANDRSIATAIAAELHTEGAEMAFTHLHDADPERPKNQNRLNKALTGINLTPKFTQACNVQSNDDLDSVFATAKEQLGTIDFLVHSIAFADMKDLKCPTIAVSRNGFKMAMEISVYSLLDLANRAKDLMPNGGSILTMTYYGGEKAIPGYNMMGICKAALESAVQYASIDLGKQNIRINAISAGPLKTLAASAVGDFRKMLALYKAFSPMKRNIEPEEVGKTAMFLLSDLASGITGENVHVDCGYHAIGGPPLDIEFKKDDE